MTPNWIRVPVALAASVWLCTLTWAAAPADINNDGIISAADTVLALRFAGGLQIPTESQFAVADVVPAGGDGRVSLLDAVRVMRIASGLDPQAPTVALPASVNLTVGTTNITRNITLPGGYTVSGTVKDTRGAPIEGYIAFRDTVSKAIVDTALLDLDGSYSARLPAGTYQAIAVSQTIEDNSLFETLEMDQAVLVGDPFTMTGSVANKNYVRPALSTPVTLTAQFSVSGITTFYPYSLTLQETEASGTQLNYAGIRDIAATPLEMSVPKGTYYVDASGDVVLSTGLTEYFTMYYDAPINVTGSLARTFSIPDTEEVAGNILAPPGVNLVDMFTQQRGTGNLATAYIFLEQDGNYLMALPRASHLFSIGFSLDENSVSGEFLQVLSVPDGGLTRNIDLPAVPTLRTVSGVVRGPDGKALEGVIVQVEPVIPSSIPTAGVSIYRDIDTTTATGAYTLTVPRGDYILSATPPGG